MSDSKEISITRREFARRAALASAATIVPRGARGGEASLRANEFDQSPELAKLSPEGQAEVNARVQAILSQYDSRLSEEQKADIRRLSTAAQSSLDHLRAYAVQNGDGTSLYLKPLIEHEKKFVPISAPQKSPSPTATPKP